jgi:arylsulfatase
MKTHTVSSVRVAVTVLSIVAVLSVSGETWAQDSAREAGSVEPAPRAVREAKYLEPHFVHREQVLEAASKLQAHKARSGERPNILILIVDDMGWGDPGVYGGGEAVGAATPNIDRLAHEGLRLTSAYSQPTCSPTRGTLLTGRLPVRHGLLRPPQIGERGGLIGEITIASLLSEAGYRTAAVGKWHLGEAPAQQPQYNGFDEYYGFLGSIKNYTEWRDPRVNAPLANDPRVVQDIENNPNFIKSLVRAGRNRPHEEVYEIDIEAAANIDIDFMRYSVDFIERMKESDQPWFLYHCFGKVHYDNYPAEGFRGASAARGVYQDAVVEVDHIVGRIVDALERTGQASDTLVFFTSDNGPEDDTWPDTGHTPFRGAKFSTWEGGVRVPGIARWPGTIAAGRVSDGLFDLADLFMTAATLGGAKVPEDRYIDGVDQTSFLLADNGSSNREAVFYYIGDTFSAMRVGPLKFHRYILQPPSDTGIPGFINGSTLQRTAGIYAFNLYLDPRERKPYGIRSAIVIGKLLRIQQRHLKTFEEYPPKVVVALP